MMPKEQATKETNWTPKLKLLWFKGCYQESEKIFANHVSKGDLYTEYIKSSYNSIIKRQITQF